MSGRSLALSADLPSLAVVAALALGALSLGLIAWELRRHHQHRLALAATGLLASALLVAAILRPARIHSQVSQMGPRVVVLADASASMQLPGDDDSRDKALQEALTKLRASAPNARMSVLSFAEGPPQPVHANQPSQTDGMRSDLLEALRSLASSAEQKPSAIVVVSDGRLDRPAGEHVKHTLQDALGPDSAPIHTVRVAERTPADASIRQVQAAGAAVAHQPLTLKVQVGCAGGLSCSELPVTVRELVEDAEPATLATGVAQVSQGLASIELPITLERAGARVVEVAVRSPGGDEIPDNDRRFLTFDVTRDRVRILHIAGRPTYDVRALRLWLKSDASLDVVAFFILRSLTDDVNASPDELALIRFPVDELFSEHLSSFDAVVLQDFDAGSYGLAPYLSQLARYVEAGGGLIMVGGLHSFTAGQYAGTSLERALPVRLVANQGRRAAIDTTPFEPVYTAAGKQTPVLEGLRALLGDRLPRMSGANMLDDPHPGTVVLWEHPTLTTSNGQPMPVLALGEPGNGRSLALAIDDSHLFAFSEMAERHAGRAYGLLWDALLGWLMRDPRYEPARVELVRPCIAGRPTTLRVRSVPGAQGKVEVTLAKLGTRSQPQAIEVSQESKSSFEVQLPPLEPGGYAARVRVGSGPGTRKDFACERGGDEWADSRPDNERLEAIAKSIGGQSVSWKQVDELKFPPSTIVAAERHVSPLLPPWAWTVAAAVALGAHWITRRRSGLL